MWQWKWAFFRLEIVLIITQLQNGSPENIKSTLCFSSFIHHKKQNLRFYSWNIAYQQYWSSERMCLEVKVWMSSFLNNRSSHPGVSCIKGVLKVNILQNPLKNKLDAAFYFNKISG